MVIRNKTPYPTEEVRELIRFATREVDMRHVCVNVKSNRHAGCSGMAYDGVPEISNAPPGSKYLVSVRVGPPELFPTKAYHGTKRSPLVSCASWQEGVVLMAAHEAKHIEQFREGLPRSEVRCEHFAAGVLNEYRAAHTDEKRAALQPS